jgi:RNA recognition motif-containing protein
VRPRSDTPRPSRLTTRTVYVGGFAATTTPEQLRALFADHGDITDVRLVDRGDASFAYVTFTSEQSAAAARNQLDRTPLAGRVLRVELAL